MNLKVLSLAGLGVLGVGAAGAVGIAASSGGGEQESEETTKPAPAPTLNQRLLEKGYTYNPPKLTNHNTLVQGCTENLLNKTGFDNSKLYGCGVAKMELWDSGSQFGNETVDYLNFASELFIRKEDEGWKINTRIDNSSGGLFYQHLLTYYRKGNNDGLVIEESFLIDIQYDYKKAKQIPFVEPNYDFVNVAIEKLNIKLPGETNSWYDKNNYLFKKSGTTSPDLIKVPKGTKEWSGIWIDKSQSDKPGMFRDIEVFIEKHENSQVFCQSCPKPSYGAGANIGLYKLKHTPGDSDVPNVWGTMSDKLIMNDNSQNTSLFIHQQGPTSPILNFIKDSKGEWIDANKFFKSESGSEINDEELNQLIIYCSKK